MLYIMISKSISDTGGQKHWMARNVSEKTDAWLVTGDIIKFICLIGQSVIGHNDNKIL